MTGSSIKRLVAGAFDKVGINAAGFNLQKMFLSPFIRAVNYHVVSLENTESFEKHLEYFSRHFVSVDLVTLDTFISTGSWPHMRPGLILSFDDGHPSHYDVVAPLLEKYAFTGWFFVPIGLMNLVGQNGGGGAEPGLTLEQLRYLHKRHIVGSHSETHCRLGPEVPLVKLDLEIRGSKRHLEKVLDSEIEVFCWVGGEEESYSRAAAALIRKNYRFSFMTNNAIIRSGTNRLHLQRTNIEASNPLFLVRFQLSGLMDLYYTPKRRRVNAMTMSDPAAGLVTTAFNNQKPDRSGDTFST